MNSELFPFDCNGLLMFLSKEVYESSKHLLRVKLKVKLRVKLRVKLNNTQQGNV